MLLLLLSLPLPATTVARRQITPDQGPDPSVEGVAVARLIEQTLGSTDLNQAVDTLALERVTLAPARTAAAKSGVHLFFVESGSFTVQTFAHTVISFPGAPVPFHENVPVGPAITHGTGDQFLILDDVFSTSAITNDGTEPAVALVVSLAVMGGAGIERSLTGWAFVEPLAFEDAARVGPFLVESGQLGAERLAVSLVRARYDTGAGRGTGGELVDETMIDISAIIAVPGARLLAIEQGALNYIVVDPALLRRPGKAPTQVPEMARISQVPGDQLVVRAPGRMLTRNVGRGPSTVLILTIGPALSATVHA